MTDGKARARELGRQAAAAATSDVSLSSRKAESSQRKEERGKGCEKD